MKILPLSIFGIDLFGALKNNNGSNSAIIGNLSLLESFKYLVTNLGIEKNSGDTEEVEELGQVLTKKIIEDHVTSTAGHIVSQNIVREINTQTIQSSNISNINLTDSNSSTLFEIPQTFMEIFSEGENY